MQQVPTHSGWIEVISGPMFSGKTEELIRRLKRALIARQTVQAFKPRIDDRYERSALASHAGRQLEAEAVGDSSDIRARLVEGVKVVGIDEAQFFDSGIAGLATELADRGVRVIVAGLDQDFRGRPFGRIPELLALAEYVTKMLAICVVCGDPAARSHRIREDDRLILPGASETYVPLCRRCFNERRAQAAAEGQQGTLRFAPEGDGDAN